MSYTWLWNGEWRAFVCWRYNIPYGTPVFVIIPVSKPQQNISSTVCLYTEHSSSLGGQLETIQRSGVCRNAHWNLHRVEPYDTGHSCPSISMRRVCESSTLVLWRMTSFCANVVNKDCCHYNHWITIQGKCIITTTGNNVSY